MPHSASKRKRLLAKAWGRLCAPSETPSSRAWSRRALSLAWVLAFGSAAASVALSWDRLLDRLAQPPAPSRAAAPRSQPLPGAGSQALGQARNLLTRGERAKALSALDGIASEDPAYPLAQQMRTQILSPARSAP